MYYSEICWLCIPDTLGTDEQKLVSDKINLMLEKHDLYKYSNSTEYLSHVESRIR